MSDSESQVIFPKQVAVAFKGDNGKYLRPQLIEGRQYLKFASVDNGDDTVKNEIFPLADGSIRIKNTSLGKFWRRNSDNWILADSDDTSGSDYHPDTLFRPIKVDHSVNRVIALKNLGNQLFCVSLTKEGKEYCLCAVEPTTTKMAHLEVHVVV